MYQINNRFFIGIIIVEVFCSIFWIFCSIGLPLWAAAIITLFLNTAYFSLFFIGLKTINDLEEKSLEEDKKIGSENIIYITKEDAKKFRKEGALIIDGKEYINKEHPLWKKNQLEL